MLPIQSLFMALECWRSPPATGAVFIPGRKHTHTAHDWNRRNCRIDCTAALGKVAAARTCTSLRFDQWKCLARVIGNMPCSLCALLCTLSKRPAQQVVAASFVGCLMHIWYLAHFKRFATFATRSRGKVLFIMQNGMLRGCSLMKRAFNF